MGKVTGGLCCIAIAVGAVLALGACGASASLEPAKSAPAPTTVDEALASLDQAEGDINRVLGGGRAASPGYAQPPGQYSGAEPGPGATPPAAPPSPVQSEATKLDAADPCETACRALASMGRAAEHLCGLAGDGDPRCDTARGRVQAATQRVQASCPACSG